MALYKTEGVVLRSRDFGEADKIVTVLTADRGKIEAVAKGARRPRSRLVGATQLCTHMAVLCFRGRSLDTLSQAEIRDSFRTLREDLLKLAHASYFAELVDQMVQDEDPHPTLLPLVLVTLHLLQALPPDDRRGMDSVRRMFELRLLAELGYRPRLDACAGCGGPAFPEAGADGAAAYFSPQLGGLTCPDCRGEAGGVRVSRGAVETMRRLLDGDPRRAPQLRWDAAIGRELQQVLRDYIGQRVERRLKSADFLESLVEPGPSRAL